MSSSPIDQILQLAPQARAATEPVQPTDSAFRDILQRASSETPPAESPEPVDIDDNDLTSTDEQPDAATSQEDETSSATETTATDRDRDSKEEPEQDTVELSDTAVALAEVETSTEKEAVVAIEQPQPTDPNSENTNAEENRQTDDSESAVPTETRGELTPNQQPTDKPAEEIEPVEEIEVQPKVISKTPERQSGETLADVRKKDKTTEKVVQTAQEKSSISEEQTVPQAEVEVEGEEAESPGDQKLVNEKPASEKPVRQGSNSEPIAAKTEPVPKGETLASDAPSVPATENRPSVAASAPAPDTTATFVPASGEDASVSQRSVGSSVASPAEAEPVPTADRARFVQRVSGAVRSAQSREGEIHLQLRPPELGSLRIEIVIKQGVLTAQLETETSAARAILLDNLPALRERLAEQEIRIEKFDVNVRDEGGQQPDYPGAEDREANRPRHQQPPHNERQQAAPISVALETSSALSSSLDVRV